MDKELLKKMKARREQRLTELREKVESGELREADLEAVKEEIDSVIDELNGIKDELGADSGTDEQTTIQMINRIVRIQTKAVLVKTTIKKKIQTVKIVQKIVLE